MKIKLVLITILISFLFSACTYDSPDDLTEEIILDPGEMVTYNSHVKIIIDNNCISCHSSPPENDAPMALVNYQDVKSAVQNRDLIQLISTQDLGEVMPLGGPRLPQNLIDIIVQWKQNGLLEQ